MVSILFISKQCNDEREARHLIKLWTPVLYLQASVVKDWLSFTIFQGLENDVTAISGRSSEGLNGSSEVDMEN